VNSRDPVSTKANAWLEPTKKASSSLAMAGSLQRLAQRLDKSPEELARTIPKDTLRRLKYPVLELPQPDGSIRYKHDLGISEELIDRPL
jgi:hypothetical protein